MTEGTTPRIDNRNTKAIVAALADKLPDTITRGETAVIALYFSASWCPPCQRLTPLLNAFYRDVHEALSQADGYGETKGDNFSRHPSFEMVYVSRDKTQEEYNTYRAKMSWSAIPFEDVAMRSALLQTFKVTGIPKVVLIDAVTFQVVDRDIIPFVRNTPTGHVGAFARFIADVKAQ